MKIRRFRFIALTSLFFFIAASFLILFSLPVHAETSEEDIYLAARQNVLSQMDSQEKAVYGNEWLALDLIRDDQPISPYYLKSVVDTIIEKDGVLHTTRGDYTNYAKTVLVLSSLGIDASDVAGYNLIEPISVFPLVAQQGVNGVIYALLALDSRNYEIQVPEQYRINVTRETYLNAIINSQLPDGGWDWADKAADPDMTAMAIQALAPYYNSNENVKSSVDTALQTLSDLQQPDGGFNTEDAAYEESSESTAMVILALTALGIDPESDPRFIKNGCSAVDNLCSFAVPEGGFTHIKNGMYNALSTDQGYRALVAYHRLLDGKTSLYDMADVTETKKIGSAITEQIRVSPYDDPSPVGSDEELIKNSAAVKDIDGKLLLLFDLQAVLADDNGTVFSGSLGEIAAPLPASVTIPEDQLANLGETVLLAGIHNGSLITIVPDSVNRLTGEVSFPASLFSTYSVVTGKAISPAPPAPSEETVTPSGTPASGSSQNRGGTDTSASAANVKTGDESDLSLWIILLAVSVIGIISGIMIYNRTNKKERVK